VDACATLDVQLILSLGGNSLSDSELGELPKNAILVPYAPQMEVLARASLCITHAGLNTALDSLAQGVPMVVIPVTNDQPGVAARISWTKTGEVIPLDQLSTGRLREAVSRVMAQPEYLERANDTQERISRLSPLAHACQLLETKVLAKMSV
jgi:zeaxanthin glucosyltransferase